MLIRLVEHCHSHGVFCLHKTGFMNKIYSKDTAANTPILMVILTKV